MGFERENGTNIESVYISSGNPPKAKSRVARGVCESYSARARVHVSAVTRSRETGVTLVSGTDRSFKLQEEMWNALCAADGVGVVFYHL